MLLTAHSPRLLLCSFIFLSILALRCCSPEGSYDNGYKPYRTAAYSRIYAAAKQNNPYYNNNNYYSTKNLQSQIPGQNRFSKADAENANFADITYLSDKAESSKTLLKLKKMPRNKRESQDPLTAMCCYPSSSEAHKATMTPLSREQGRLIWNMGAPIIQPGLLSNGHRTFITPGGLIGALSSTANNIFQQLTGNVRPG